MLLRTPKDVRRNEVRSKEVLCVEFRPEMVPCIDPKEALCVVESKRGPEQRWLKVRRERFVQKRCCTEASFV